MENIDLRLVLWYANLGASMLLLLRLVRQQLRSTYPVLCLYLATDIVQQASGLAVQSWMERPGLTYLKIYATGQAIKVVLIIFIVLELYQIALTEYPAVGRYARNVAGYMLAGAALVASGLLWLTPSTLNASGWRLRLQYVLGFERTVDSASLFLLLFMAAFLLWFPVRLSRNIAWCLGCFTAYLCARWAGLFTLGVRPEFKPAVDNGLLTVSLICFLAMARVMAWEGEKSAVSGGNRWDPKRMQRLRTKLDALESYLAGLGKKQRHIAQNRALHSSEL